MGTVQNILDEAINAWVNYEPIEFKDNALKHSNEIRHAFISGYITAKTISTPEPEEIPAPPGVTAGCVVQLRSDDQVVIVSDDMTKAFGFIWNYDTKTLDCYAWHCVTGLVIDLDRKAKHNFDIVRVVSRPK